MAPREHVAGGAVEEHFGGDRKLALRAGRFRLHGEEGGILGVDEFKE